MFADHDVCLHIWYDHVGRDNVLRLHTLCFDIEVEQRYHHHALQFSAGKEVSWTSVLFCVVLVVTATCSKCRQSMPKPKGKYCGSALVQYLRFASSLVLSNEKRVPLRGSLDYHEGGGVERNADNYPQTDCVVMMDEACLE
jgi:hypothetical protein